MSEQPPNPGPGAEPPGSEESTRRASEDARTIKVSREVLSGGQNAPMIGLTVGKYTIKRVIGSGGMGTVYEAMQQSPRRIVALKMLKQGIASRSALRRFEYEAQTLGRLRHEHIAQIYEAGTWDDGTGARPYFAMEYLVGARTLTQYARNKKFGTRERLELFSKVCDAVQHGHQKGIIHRDLKPENILVTSSGVPKVIDFGVARSTDSDMAVTTLQTDVGALIGTLQYMSPEQCAADPNDIDTRSDVYALGVILFELLCEDLPYDVTKVAIHEAARIVQEDEPTRPSTVDKRLRGDVEIITLKALEKDRDRRYQSAVELEQDIGRYLAGDSITAKAPSAFDYLKRFARKHKAASISIAAIFVVLVAALIAISIFAVEAQHQRILAVEAKEEAEDKSIQLESQNVALAMMQDQAAREEAKAVAHASEADKQREQAEEARAAALWEAYYGNIRAAELAHEKLDNSTMEKSLWRAAQAMGSYDPDELPFEWQYLHARSDDALQVTRIPLQYWLVHREAEGMLNRNGSQIVFGSRKKVHIYDLPSGKLRLTLPTERNLMGCVFSPDGSRVVSSDSDAVRIWNVRTGEQITTVPNGDSFVGRVSISPDNTRVAFRYSTDHEHSIAILDADTGDLVSRLSSESNYPLVFSPDSTRLASGTNGPVITIWDVATGEKLSSLESWSGGGRMRELAFSPDGLRLAGASTDSLIRVWDIGSGEILATLSGHEREVACIAFSPDGRLLASGSVDSTVRVWDTHAGSELLRFVGHDNDVKSVAFSDDGTELVSAEYGSLYTWPTHDDQRVARSPGVETRTWRIEPRQTYSTFSGENAIESLRYLESIAFSPDGMLLAGSCWASAQIGIWDVTTGQLLATCYGDVERSDFSSTGGDFDRLVFSPDGTRIAAGWDWKEVFIWDTRTGEQEHKLVGHESAITSLAYNPSGTLLASASEDGAIMLWDTATGDRVATFRAEDKSIQSLRSVAFSPDGTRVLAGHYRFINFWDVKTGQLLSEWDTRDYNEQILFSPDRNDMVSVRDGRILDADTGDLRRRIDDDFSFGGYFFAFHPDGTRIAKASNYSNVSIWDYDRGEVMMEWPNHGGRGGLAFSPDGSRMGVSNGSSIQVFDTRSFQELVREREDALERNDALSPIVDSWFERAQGDKEIVLDMLERAVEQRSRDEAITLRNLTLNKFYVQQLIRRIPERIEELDSRNSSSRLNQLAWGAAILDDKAFFNAVSDDVLRASQRACEISDYENAMYLDTLARVHFERGEIDEAIKWQETAMQHIPEGDDKGTFQEWLDRYREAASQDAQE